MMKALLLAALLATSAQCALAQTLVSPQADATSNANQGAVASGYDYLFNGTTWDRGRGGAAADNSGTVPNTGIRKVQLFIYNASAGNVVPLSSGSAVTDANALANTLSIANYAFNGATWDRIRAGAASNNVGTGVQRVQPEEGYSSNLNISAATTVKATAGRIFKLNVVVAGATGQVCDAAGACGATTVVFQIPAVVGTYDLNWPMATGIRVEPGAAQVVAVSWN